MRKSTERMKETALTDASPRSTGWVSDIQREALRDDIRRRLVTALVRSGDAVSDPKLARLPGPVRYRVTGALAAWDALRAATDCVASPTLTEMLRPHFRMQPYGPQAASRKLIFVGPTLVRPDRLRL